MTRRLLLIALSFLVPTTSVCAQKKVKVPSKSGTIIIQTEDALKSGFDVSNPEAMKALQEAQKKAAEAQKAAAVKAAEQNKKPDAKKPDGKKADGKKADGKKADGKKDGKDAKSAASKIKRPDKFEGTPDPKELELRPDEKGRVQFNFTGQPWPDVVQWLADINKFSLYYDDLPGDYLSLTTQRSYQLAEARDVINQHLLARGYTILVEGETLVVVEVSKLNKAMIPRVAPEELVNRQPHEFVRTSFRLEWLVAGDAVTELKPMLSKHGNLYQLASTNRIEAFDTVANLLAIYQLIEEEQSEQVEEGLVRQFKIQHRRASDVMELVQRLMGINPDNPAQPLSSSQMKQIQKAIATAQKSAAGQVVRAPVPTTLVLNQRENSILVTAEPDKMKQIEQAIEQLDVPADAGEALLGNMGRMRIYRLNSYDPKPLVDLLEELGQLDPQTKLEVDERNRSIMAYASLADHLLISQLIEKVDGSTRRFEVIQLRKLDAESVSGTIRFMMGEEEQSGNRYDWDFYYYRNRRGSSNEEDKFRVDADVDNNRLLLRANEVEMAEIKNLLKKLGEDPDNAVMPQGELIRVYDIPKQNSQDILERFQKLWHLNNKLEIDIEPTPKPAESSTVGQTTQVAPKPPRYQHTRAQSGATSGNQDDAAADFFRRLTERTSPEEPETPAVANTVVPRREADPVRISIRDGRIIVTSNDPVALEAANRLLQQMLPQQEQVGYKIYTMEHVSPGWMAITLEDFFDIDTGFSSWGWGPPQEDKASLSKKKEMRFITDSYTNTLLVQNATSEDLRTIESLIARFDQPVSSESRLVRKTEAFHIRHSKADTIATVVKEVYRDLLSGNDKALQQDGNNGKKGSGSSTPMQFFGSSSTYLTDAEDEKVKFSGQLSVGVDPISNTVIVSGTEALVKDIGEKIEILDQAAQPSSNMRVIPVSRNIDIVKLQQRLEKLVGPKQQPNPQQPQKNGQPNNGNNPKTNNGGNPQPQARFSSPNVFSFGGK